MEVDYEEKIKTNPKPSEYLKNKPIKPTIN